MFIDFIFLGLSCLVIRLPRHPSLKRIREFESNQREAKKRQKIDVVCGAPFLPTYSDTPTFFLRL